MSVPVVKFKPLSKAEVEAEVMRGIKAELDKAITYADSLYADEGYPAHLPKEVVDLIFWSITHRKTLLGMLAEAKENACECK